MKRHTALALAALSRHLSTGEAQVLSYITAVVTECYDEAETSGAQAQTTAPTQLAQCSVGYTMPACDACGCPTCTAVSTFTTAYPVFCSTGLTSQTYTVEETYLGMSTVPNFAETTDVPYGFTVSEATCTVCATTPIVETLTFPSDSLPYNTELSGVILPSNNPVVGTAAGTAAGSDNESQVTVHGSAQTTSVTLAINESGQSFPVVNPTATAHVASGNNAQTAASTATGKTQVQTAAAPSRPASLMPIMAINFVIALYATMGRS